MTPALIHRRWPAELCAFGEAGAMPVVAPQTAIEPPVLVRSVWQRFVAAVRRAVRWPA